MPQLDKERCPMELGTLVLVGLAALAIWAGVRLVSKRGEPRRTRAKPELRQNPRPPLSAMLPSSRQSSRDGSGDPDPEVGLQWTNEEHRLAAAERGKKRKGGCGNHP